MVFLIATTATGQPRGSQAASSHSIGKKTQLQLHTAKQAELIVHLGIDRETRATLLQSMVTEWNETQNVGAPYADADRDFGTPSPTLGRIWYTPNGVPPSLALAGLALFGTLVGLAVVAVMVRTAKYPRRAGATGAVVAGEQASEESHLSNRNIALFLGSFGSLILSVIIDDESSGPHTFLSLHTLSEFSRELGFALLIALVVIVTVEIQTRKEFNKNIFDKIKNIQENFFSAVFEKDIPSNITSEIRVRPETS